MRGSAWVMVGVLMLAAVLAAPGLNMDSFSYDEIRSLIVTGGAHHGPLAYPSEVWARVAEQSPDQALGFPLVARLWGDLVGWSEPATRVLPYLAGLLAIAVTYRLGRDLFGPFVGVSAALMLATSVLYITYLHKFRVFTIASLSVAVTLWCYWRMALSGRKTGWLAPLGFVVGGIGLLYTHYFTTPFALSLALIHLFIAPKTRRWWLPVLLALPILLVFIPELNVLVRGFQFNLGKEYLQTQNLTPGGIVLALFVFFSNGYPLLLALLFPLMVWALFLPGQRRERWALALGSVVLLVTIIVMNEFAEVFLWRRVRYLIGLWVPLALWLSVALWELRRVRVTLPAALLTAWAVLGIVTTVDGTLMEFDTGDDVREPTWRELIYPVHDGYEPGDVFLFIGYRSPQYGHYSHGIEQRPLVAPYMPDADIDAGIAGALRVWLGVQHVPLEGKDLTAIRKLDAAGYTPCPDGEIMRNPDFALTLYSQSPAYCPTDAPPLAVYGGTVALHGLEMANGDAQLSVSSGWALPDDFQPWTYSAGFHLLNDAGELVAQADVGFDAADGPYTPMHAVIDTADLPPGDYDLRVVVYAWESGTPLIGEYRERVAVG